VSDNDDFNLHLMNSGGPIYDLRLRYFANLLFYRSEDHAVRHTATAAAQDYFEVVERGDREHVRSLMGVHQSERLDRLEKLIAHASAGRWNLQTVHTFIDVRYRDALDAEHLERFRVTGREIVRVRGSEDFDKFGWNWISLEPTEGSDPQRFAKELVGKLESIKEDAK
jgi:hypothetical protein